MGLSQFWLKLRTLRQCPGASTHVGWCLTIYAPATGRTQAGQCQPSTYL